MNFIENIEKEKYEKFVKNHPKSHFLQSYAWGEFCRKIKGQIPYYVGMIDDDNNLVATALILLKKTPLGYSYGYSPRGFILDYTNKELIKEFTLALKKFMKDNKLIYIKFDPDIFYQDIDEDANPIENGNNNYDLYNYMLSLGYIHTGFYRLYEGNQPRYTFRIDLKRKWEVIESRMSKSFLQSVKRSYQYDLKIDNEIKIPEFYELIKSTSQKDGFNPHDIKYYETLVQEFKDNIKFYNVSIDIKKVLSNIEMELDSLNENKYSVSKKKMPDYLDKIKRLENEKDLNSRNNFSPEKVMVKRDINRIFLNTRYDNKFFLAQWDMKTKEEKQEFISRYIESMTFKKDKNCKHGIRIVDLKLKSIFKEKVNKLSEIGASEIPVYLISNDKPVRVNIGCPLKESQIKEYLNELNKYHATNFYIHPTFNHSIEDLPDEIIFNINKDERLFRLIPIIKDIDNPENVFNKFKLGIVTTSIKSFPCVDPKK